MERFKTRIVNPAAALNIFNSGEYSGEIGHYRIDKSLVQGLYSDYDVEGGMVTFTTKFNIKPEGKKYSDLLINKKRLNRSIESRYSDYILSPYQLLIESEDTDEEHEIKKCDTDRRNAGNGHFILLSTAEMHNSQRFLSLLENHAYLVESFFKSLYDVETDVPEITYTFDIGADGMISVDNGNVIGCDNSSEKISGLEKKILVTNPRVSFDDIGGNQGAKLEMQRLYEDIIFPDNSIFFGRNPSKTNGCLISGESGCGKTLLVKALATKLIETFGDGIRFYSANYSDITSIYRGGEAQSTAKLFDLARKNQKNNKRTLLFLDELQSVGVRQSQYNEALDTLLTQLDGISHIQGLTFIGATYMDLESIDPALKRRLSNHIQIPNPDHMGREEMLKIHMEQRSKLSRSVGNSRLFGEVDSNQIACEIEGFNGSKIERLIEVAVQKKQDEVRKKLPEEYSIEDMEKALSPINTQFILNQVAQVRTEGIRSKGRVGFN